MGVNFGNVAPAAAAPLCGLMLGQLRLDGWAECFHQMRTKQPSQASRQKEWALSVGFVRSVLFGYPDEEFRRGSQDCGGPDVAVFGNDQGLSQKVCREPDSVMEDFVWDVVSPRGLASCRQDRSRDASDCWVGLVRDLQVTRSEVWAGDSIAGHTVLRSGCPDLFA